MRRAAREYERGGRYWTLAFVVAGGTMLVSGLILQASLQPEYDSPSRTLYVGLAILGLILGAVGAISAFAGEFLVAHVRSAPRSAGTARRFCSECGNPASVAARFCEHCGAPMG